MRKPYRSDLTDQQWDLIRDLLPAAKSGGRPRQVDLREVVNTLMYQARTGCQSLSENSICALNLDELARVCGP